MLGVPAVEFGDGPLDGFVRPVGEVGDPLDGNAARDGDVGDVVLALDARDGVEDVTEAVVERRQAGALDAEVDDRRLAGGGLQKAVDPGDPDTRVMTASPHAGRAHDVEDEAVRTHDEPNDPYSVVYRRRGAEPWQHCTDGLPDPAGLFVPVLATVSDQPATFYALTNRGLYRSTDSGNTWNEINLPWNDGYREQQPRSVAATSVREE